MDHLHVILVPRNLCANFKPVEIDIHKSFTGNDTTLAHRRGLGLLFRHRTSVSTFVFLFMMGKARINGDASNMSVFFLNWHVYAGPSHGRPQPNTQCTLSFRFLHEHMSLFGFRACPTPLGSMYLSHGCPKGHRFVRPSPLGSTWVRSEDCVQSNPSRGSI